jgi:hypothetical protein
MLDCPCSSKGFPIVNLDIDRDIGLFRLVLMGFLSFMLSFMLLCGLAASGNLRSQQDQRDLNHLIQGRRFVPEVQNR